MSDLEEIIHLIEIHHCKHPDHGIDCACMDRWIYKIRRMTEFKLQSSVGTTAQQRIDYVLRKAVENRT